MLYDDESPGNENRRDERDIKHILWKNETYMQTHTMAISCLRTPVSFYNPLHFIIKLARFDPMYSANKQNTKHDQCSIYTRSN